MYNDDYELTIEQEAMIHEILDRDWEEPKDFAQNILDQGWCSPLQDQALRNIYDGYMGRNR